ncbi:VirB3 family type IV secretion system protein [Escherichia coli]|uniref:VirB3 family type IV secretion system protein n=1 Tax=Escherichia coli TaxID=562 RepID=UPI000CDBD506|nr:VirB3 family type IV secretion system protein [Escherichia coli]AUZ03763.1 type IV secretion system protein VirB3 [Escherichia coli]
MFVDGKRPLFKGATRLPRALGVPRNVAMMIFMILLAFYDYSYVGDPGVRLFVDSFSCINKYDDRMFRIMGLWLKPNSVIGLILRLSSGEDRLIPLLTTNVRV